MFLADYDYNINYVKGEENTVADALSRIPTDDNVPAESPLIAALILSHSHLPSRRKRLPAAAAGALSIQAEIQADH
jgi:hypothetical protein